VCVGESTDCVSVSVGESTEVAERNGFDVTVEIVTARDGVDRVCSTVITTREVSVPTVGSEVAAA
jgi:hypothetical protein